MNSQNSNFPVVSEGHIGNAAVSTVNARDLHGFLEVGTRFNDWIAARVEQYGFSEGLDFTTFTENAVKGRPSIEYAISIDMAKELAMVERNEKGRPIPHRAVHFSPLLLSRAQLLRRTLRLLPLRRTRTPS